MNTREWIAAQIAGPVKPAAPCLFYPLAASEGALDDVLLDAGRQAEVLRRIPERYPVGAVIRMSELWCEAAAFGAECEFAAGAFPRILGPVAREAGELADIPVPETVNRITGPMLESVESAAKSLDRPLFAGMTGPYTLGSVLCGSEDFMVNCMTEPEAVLAFLERLAGFLIDYARQYKAAGAAGVMLAEPSIAMISPAMAEEFSHRIVRRLIDAVQDDGFSIIYHNCGEVSAHLPQLSGLGAHAYHFGDAVALETVLKTFPGDALIMGNIHPAKFAQASEADVERETATALEKYASFPNFMLSSGCDIGPGAKAANLDAFFAVAESRG